MTLGLDIKYQRTRAVEKQITLSSTGKMMYFEEE